jgi:hypothetical protein
MIARTFGILAIGAGALSGCGGSLDQVNKPGAGAVAGALIGATSTRGSSEEDQRLASGAGALIGYVIGSAATSPCRTTQSGVVIETNGQRSQSQQTAYRCTSEGAPAGARPPVFNLIANNEITPADVAVLLTEPQISELIDAADQTKITSIAHTTGVTVSELKNAAVDMATSGTTLIAILDGMNAHGIQFPAQTTKETNLRPAR